MRRDYFRAGTLPRRVHDLSELLKVLLGGCRESFRKRRWEALGSAFLCAHILSLSMLSPPSKIQDYPYNHELILPAVIPQNYHK